MKKAVLLLSLLAISGILLTQAIAQSGFVTLQGKQFKLDGNDFYPIAVCYGFGFYHDPNYVDLDHIYLARNEHYGPGKDMPGFNPNLLFESYDHNTWDDDIKADFIHLKSMGFNSIRTYGTCLEPKPNSTTGFIYKVYSTQDWDDVPLIITINPPYNDQNPAFKKYCDMHQEILNIASDPEVGIKVLFDVNDKNYTVSQNLIDDYANFLHAFASHFKNDPTLMAYVLFEEPYNTDDDTYHSKQQICEITTQWYDAIKTDTPVADPNHLITISGGDVLDVNEWDPAVLKVDFYSPHPYSNTTWWENYSYDDMYNRVLGRLIWLDRNCPLPWIIGELAIGAQDDCWGLNEANPPVWTPFVLEPPEVTTGDLQEQKLFAEQTLDAVRNCHGSGYTWWQFQETWWLSYDNTDPTKSHDHDAMGLLRHAAIDSQRPLEKPVVQAFMDYPYPPPAPEAVSEPSNYKDPFNGEYNLVGGFVYDQDGHPIKDAVIHAWEGNMYIYGITDAAGNYGIRGHDLNIKFTKLIVSAVGYNSQKMEYFNGILGLNNNFHLIKSCDYNLIIASFQPENYAINTITINNNTTPGLIVHSANSAVYKARNEVNVHNNFTAEYGSNVHILTEPFLYQCDTWPQDIYFRPPLLINYDSISSKYIEVEFNIPSVAICKIFPNPCNDEFKLELLKSGSLTENIKILEIRNYVGQIIKSIVIGGNELTVNVSDYPRGIYILKICRGLQTEFKKLIIQ